MLSVVSAYSMLLLFLFLFCVCSVLSCFVSVFVRFHMDFVDDFMENLLVVMLILSFIGISKCNFCHTPSPSLASISPSTHLTFEIFLFLYNSCAPHIYLLHNDTFFLYFPIKSIWLKCFELDKKKRMEESWSIKLN